MKVGKQCPECFKWFVGRSKYCSYKCSAKATEQAIKELQEKRGPVYEKWKARLKASLEHL